MSLIVKLNLRLIRISKFIQRFRNFEFRYKFNKKYIVFNSLLRLSNIFAIKQIGENKLDTLYDYAYNIISFIELNPELRKQVLNNYKKNSN